MKLLGVSASPSADSKTLLALTAAVAHVRWRYDDVATDVINLRDLDMAFCDGRDPDRYEGDTRVVIDTVVAADALIIATPMYRGSYTGILKNLVDVLPNDALQGKPVGLIASGGSDHHFLAVEHQLKPLIGFFYGHPIPGAVYLNNDHFAAGRLADPGIIDRLAQLVDAVVEFARRVPRTVVGADRPTITRKTLAET
ncbi:NADPH-dependent FMN reductase [Pseudonocardia hispaniensis]|uniref:NADPH-dependent FMN reductase n=2 Tax=Pseudonocardia hispaniensis TaxID=904933 RepID=A0ABW1J884_9PSEU